MEADWSVELAAEDPVILVPWQAGGDPSRGVRFIDLCGHPEEIHEIQEAAHQPDLRATLLALNQSHSKFWTAKCDIWSSDTENAGNSIDRFEMDALPEEAKFSSSSYIDILPRDLEMSGSFTIQEGWLRRLTARLRDEPLSCARTDFVLRRAEVWGRTGFGITWFVVGCGAGPELAERRWAKALDHTLPIVMNGTL